MSFIIVQTDKKCFHVARSTGGGPYRTLCKCADEHSARVVKDALEKAHG